MSKECFLRSLSVNSSLFVLLKGKLAIFIDNNYISSSSSLEGNVYPSDPLVLSLGVDPAVSLSLISKQATKLVSSVASVFGKRQQVETVTKLFCVDNHHSYTIHLFLFDCLPVSFDSNFVVKLITPSDIPDPSTTPSPSELTDVSSPSSISSTTTSSSSSNLKDRSKNNESNSNTNNNNSEGGDGPRRVGLLAAPTMGEKDTVSVNYAYVNKTDQVIRWNVSLASMGSTKIKFEYTIQSTEGVPLDSSTQTLPSTIFNVCF